MWVPVARLRVCVLTVGVVACALSASGAVAATLRVNTTRDELRPHDGRCSLREAVAAVGSPGRPTDCGKASRDSDTIVLPAGHDRLSIPPVGQDDNATGDLNLKGRVRVTITGAGPRGSVIDAGGLGDRVLSVGPRASLVLRRLRITGGRPDVACGMGDGGGVYNAGTLLLDSVVVVGNRAGTGACAGGSGGGLYNRGRLTLVDSTVARNTAGTGGAPGEPGGGGGGIYSRGRLVVTASTLYGNRAGSGGAGDAAGSGGPGGWGGGVLSAGGDLKILNTTLADNLAGAGGPGAALPAGRGGNGGGVAVSAGASWLRNATVAGNGVGSGGPGPGRSGARGSGGGLYVQVSSRRNRMRLQNTIVASNHGQGCVGAIADGGHDLLYGDGSCPGRRGNPRLGPLKDNGGSAETMALAPGSPAIDRIPHRHNACPVTDERGVHRNQGSRCDIGAYEFARPTIRIIAPSHHSYERGSRIRARFRCTEGGITSPIAKCHGTVRPGRPIRTGRVGSKRFVVTAIDKSGQRSRRTVRYLVWAYVNPLRAVRGLAPRRIDLGVDYGGSGPLLALGRGKVTMASDTDSGPSSCWAISCWPGGGIVVYRLLDGPFAGKYVYVAEHLTVNVSAGQTVRAGERIAMLYPGYPWSEWGWAAGPGPEALAMADGHRCTCSDPGGWSTIEGRNMNQILVRLGAPSGWLQSVPNQSMPAGWPTWPR